MFPQQLLESWSGNTLRLLQLCSAVAVAQLNAKQNKVQRPQRRLVSEASVFSFCCFPEPNSNGSAAGQGSGSGLGPASVHHLLSVPGLIG